MKIRALANGDVIEAEADAATELIASGIYEEVAAEEPVKKPKSEPKPKKAKEPKEKKKPSPREYKRRDMQAES